MEEEAVKCGTFEDNAPLGPVVRVGRELFNGLRRDRQILDWLEENHDKVSIFPDYGDKPDGETIKLWCVYWNREYRTFLTLREAVEFAMKEAK